MTSFHAISYVQFSVVMMGVYSSSGPTENVIKILNTENIVLTMKDINDDDNNDDLELIQNVSENPELNKKLRDFHRVVAKLQMSERPEINSQTVASLDERKPTERHSLTDNEKIKRKRLKWLKKLKARKYFWKNKWMVNKREAARPPVAITTSDYADLEIEMNNLENEYEEFLIKSRNANLSYKYTDEGKPEENFKDVVSKLIDFKIPADCTNITGIGIQAVECIVRRGNTNEISKLQMYERISYILLTWFCIYLGVAIPFWCIKGWCCCCFRCWFCFPNRTVREIHKYITENPPGVYVNTKGEEEHYHPNVRETQLYEKIKKAVAEY